MHFASTSLSCQSGMNPWHEDNYERMQIFVSYKYSRYSQRRYFVTDYLLSSGKGGEKNDLPPPIGR